MVFSQTHFLLRLVVYASLVFHASGAHIAKLGPLAKYANKYANWATRKVSQSATNASQGASRAVDAGRNLVFGWGCVQVSMMSGEDLDPMILDGWASGLDVMNELRKGNDELRKPGKQLRLMHGDRTLLHEKVFSPEHKFRGVRKDACEADVPRVRLQLIVMNESDDCREYRRLRDLLSDALRDIRLHGDNMSHLRQLDLRGDMGLQGPRLARYHAVKFGAEDYNEFKSQHPDINFEDI